MTPENYKSQLTLRETEEGIKYIKDFFERSLATMLNLTRVSAPLFVEPETGLNDDLNGTEKPVTLAGIGTSGKKLEIVHSLAKWKRNALKRYEFEVGEGLYTDMNAIRVDEEIDNVHSIYVDQWDWEKVITKEQRTIETLKDTVKSIYQSFLITEDFFNAKYPKFRKKLPKELTFITSEELLEKYPNMTSSEREKAIAKERGAVFIMQIGDKLSNGVRHDGRAPDYDDWSLNGDLIFYYELLDMALEVSSMGIRVDEKALQDQLVKAGKEELSSRKYHKDIMEGNLPYTIGGGIGQSRICMFLMEKAHIGEVQVSYWDDELLKKLSDQGVNIL